MIPALRNKILDRRRGMSESETAQLSSKVCRHFIEVSDRVLGQDYWAAKKVGLYRTQHSVIPGEVDPSSLEKILMSQKGVLSFPRIINRESKAMEFAQASQDSNWTLGPYGLHEPAESQQATLPQDLDVIFVPGVAYGRSGERIGMGVGFYDRYLQNVKKALRISLAFDFQIYDQLEQNPWDQRVHWIIGETEEIRHAS